MPASRSALSETASLELSLFAPSFEALERRLMLSAPTFDTALSQGYWVPVSDGSSTYNTRVIGIDGSPDTTSITAAIDGAPVTGLTVTVQNGMTYTYADICFVTSDGTLIGDVVFQLYDGATVWTDSLLAAQRFEDLATNGVTSGVLDPDATPFYNDTIVHRVIPGFMIQTGDNISGDGTGSSGLAKLTDSFDPNLSFVGAGVVAMANTGSADTSDCQFFITNAPTDWLNGQYIIIGQVVSGWDVIDTIINLPRNASDRPDDPPIMQSVTIFHSVSEATVTLTTGSTFTGSANVKITLTDADGHTTDQIIEVVPQSEMPTLITSTTPAWQTIAPGASGTVQAQFTDIAGLPMTYTASSSLSGATATIDSTTQVVSVTVPSTFTGLFTATVTATQVGGYWADPLPVVVSFNVISQNTYDPQFESSTLDDADGQAIKTVAYGNYALVAMGSSGVVVYDVTLPDNPVKVCSYDTAGSVRDIVVVGQIAYVADTYSGVVALDISDPTDISLIDMVATASAAVNIAVDPVKNIMYVADYDAGLTEVDVSNPANMVVLRSIKELSATFGITTAVDVVLKGKYAFVADASGGVVVLSIADPANVKMLSSFGTAYEPWGLDIVGNTLFVADQYLIAYNVANPAKPKLVGYLDLSSAWQVSVVNGMALVGSNEGLSIVDVSDPANMVLQYAFNVTSFVGSCTVVGNDLAVAAGPDGLLMFQGTRTVTNQRVTFLDDNQVPVTLAIQGGSLTMLNTGYNSGTILSLEIINSSPVTTLTITTPSGKTTTVGDITDAIGSLKSIIAKTADVTGSILVVGSLETLTVRDMIGSSQRTIVVGNDASVARNINAFLNVSLRNVTNLSLNSQVPVSSLTVNNWADTGTDDQIVTLSIGKLTVKGNLAASVELSGLAGLSKTLGTVKIGGDVTGDWNIQGDVGSVKIGNAVNWNIGSYGAGSPLGSIASLTAGNVAAATIDAIGYLGKIKVRSWAGGSITAGRSAGITTTAGDFHADLTLTGAGVPAGGTTLGSLKSAGTIDGIWSIIGGTGALSGASIPSTWDATITGNIKSLTISHDASGHLKAGSITGMTVKGKYGDGVSGDTTLKLTQPFGGAKVALGSLRVGGWLDNVDVISLDRLGTVAAGGITGSNIYAGVLDVDDVLLPIDSIDHTVLSAAGIAGVTVKGIKGAVDSFINSNLAGWNMGTLNLNTIQEDNSANGIFGVAANYIKTYTAKISVKPYKWTPKVGAWPNDTTVGNGDYEVLQAV